MKFAKPDAAWAALAAYENSSRQVARIMQNMMPIGSTVTWRASRAKAGTRTGLVVGYVPGTADLRVMPHGEKYKTVISFREALSHMAEN